ncbi:MAG: HPr family phosphocarrier protein [Eubacterium sp.]|nr:HPr family phosphocarrier protein [Eubacterium sp.]
MIKKNIEVAADREEARTIAVLVQLASQYQSSISICQENRTVNAKSIMGMMTLGLAPGKELEVSVDGEDETVAMDTIVQYLVQ